MRSAIIFFTVALTTSSVLAQTSLPPSPTASVGCEPHGDHWHCDGPASVTSAAASAASTEAHDHDHEEDATASVTAAVSNTTTTGTVTDAEGTGTLAPSPTESTGCEPHGDHWHCDGPASGTSTVESASASATEAVATGGIGESSVDKRAVLGGLVLAMGIAL
ncbi:hypothetical protein F5Y15DRAFT_416220 [Xylariaceae sp. FL0016]|nr:hypothetical protein F5Y15DRAFT_416220 [Xylariaceae sp. FL0016]